MSLFPRFLTGLFALALIAGCAKRETTVELGNRTQVLHQNIGAEPQDLDPPLMQTNSHYQVLMALYEGLTGYDPQDLHPVPGVAERWDLSDDGLTYTFHLRTDAKWSNGDPVTAPDFAFSAQRTLSPALGSAYPFYYFVVRGAQDFATGKTKDFATVGIRALDEHTLRIELHQPAPYLLFLLGSFAWMPVHRATVEKAGRFDQAYTGWTKPGKIVTNGPFELTEWKPGQEITVRRNPRYWDAANVRLNEIHFHLIENIETEERAFRSGQLHLTEYVPGSKLKNYHDNEPALLKTAPFFMTYFYGFDTTRPPFNDVRVRQAFSFALDRDRLIASEPYRGLRAARSYVPPGVDGYTYAGPDQLRFDPAEARRLLAAAGYPNGQGFPVVDITFPTNGRHQQIAEVLQQMWQQHLGLHLKVVNKEGRVYYEELGQKRYQLARAGWVGDYLDAHAFLSVYVSDSGQNNSGWGSPAYDRLVHDSLNERDRTKRQAIYRELESIFLRELPVLPLFHDSSPHLVNPAVRGWYPNLLNYHPYQRMSLEPQ